MNLDNVFKLNPSLEMFSGIAVAICYWERSDIKSRIDHNFSESKKLCYDPDKPNDVNTNQSEGSSNLIDGNNSQNSQAISSAQKVVNFIFEEINLLDYPEKLSRSIKTFIVKIGQKICYWRDYVTRVLKLDVCYASKIYWTSYGEIDELKILHDFWLKDPKFPNKKCAFKCFMGHNYLYCLTCIYAQEDFVKSHFEEMKIKILTYLPKSYKKKKWTPYSVLSTWICFCIERTRKNGHDYFEKYIGNPLSQIPAKDLFYKCIAYGFEFGLQYFWNKLTTDEKQELVTRGAHMCLDTANSTIKRRCFAIESINDPETRPKAYMKYAAVKREAAVRMLLFLVNKMTEIQKIKFLKKYLFFLFKFLIETWPYQELCEKILDVVCDYSTEKHRKKVLELLVYNLTVNVKHHLKTKYLDDTKEVVKAKDPTLYFTTKRFYNNLLRIIMGKVSKKSKQEIFNLDENFNIENLYENRDYLNLSVILNDPDLKDRKERMLSLGINHFRECINKGDYNSVNEFIEVMTFANVELQWFKQKLNLITAYLMKRDISLANRNLNWLCESDEERIKLKKEIDASEICFILIKTNKFETADEFLIWRFSTEEERKNVKKTLISNGFLTKRIFELWENANASGLETTPAVLCSKLLNWFFDTDEEITNFIITKFVREQRFILQYFDILCTGKALSTEDEFLKFCLPTCEEIKLLKNSIANNVNWWIDTYAFENLLFLVIFNLINWAFEYDVEKIRNAMQSCINSPRGALLCVKALENYVRKSATLPKLVLNFFQYWIDVSSSNFTAIKLYLDGLEGSGVERNIIFNVKKLLDYREAGNSLEDWAFDKTLGNEENDSEYSCETDSEDESLYDLYHRTVRELYD